MKRPLAYITAPWGENEYENTENAARTLDGILTVKGQGRSH